MNEQSSLKLLWEVPYVIILSANSVLRTYIRSIMYRICTYIHTYVRIDYVSVYKLYQFCLILSQGQEDDDDDGKESPLDESLE